MNRLSFVIVASLVLVLAGVQATARADPSPAATPSSSATPGASSTQNTAQQPAPAASQGQEAKLQTVVVTATRVEQPIDQVGTTISVVSDQQMQSQKIEQVGTALQQVPGVNVTQSGSAGTETDVSIRGASPSQSLILIDGRVRFRESNHRQLKPHRGSARRGRIAIWLASDRRRDQCSLAGRRRHS